ncbi:hypothetical protein [Runella sp. SP2]|uniref:hypothetical protein n=1 Tax=Runella sp. SP2 TaxID=2268026 RepID=UPI0013DDA3A2|nr:hypothetical protein [Runella sp. SP2]
MKKLLSIGLLIVLLYHMFGLSVALLCFEDEYQSASPVAKNDQWDIIKIPLQELPYVSYQEIPAEQEGLIRKDGDFYNIVKQYHKDDTLYIVLKTNHDARERFTELSNQIQESLDATSKAPLNPVKKTIALFLGLSKTYVSNAELAWPPLLFAGYLPKSVYCFSSQIPLDSFFYLLSPPPEFGKLA